MPTALIIAIPIVLGVFCLLVILKFIMGNVNKNLLKEVDERFAGRKIIMKGKANFFGQKSRGVGQIRGNGMLVLTEDELWFLLAMPQDEYSIDFKSIISVTTVKSHLGKTVFYPLLCVEFLLDGKEDSIAWAMKDSEKWKKAIKSMIKDSLIEK